MKIFKTLLCVLSLLIAGILYFYPKYKCYQETLERKCFEPKKEQRKYEGINYWE